VIREPAAPRHPLAGIVAALAELRRPVVAIGCDMPFVAPELLGFLAGLDEPLAVCSVADRMQPLLGRYAPVLLPQLQVAVGDARPLRGIVSGLAPRVLADEELRRFGDPDRMTFNVNDEHDLALAGRL
jgi:molybdopterin-guanine dinucleotide biosynthesis protein A